MIRHKEVYIVIIAFIGLDTTARPINTELLEVVEQVSAIRLSPSEERINFDDLRERPYLYGTPRGFTRAHLREMGHAPLCYVPARGGHPYLNLPYDRTPYVLKLRDWYVDPASCGAIYNEQQKVQLKYMQWPVYMQIAYEPNKPIIRIGKGLHLLQICAIGYYHFVVEALPRLLLARAMLESDPDIKILISPPATQFMWEYFDILGIDRQRIVVCDTAARYLVDELYYPRPSFMGYPSKEELHRLSCACKSSLGITKQDENDLIVVVERLGGRRHVSNTAELVCAMQKAFPAIADKIVTFYGTESVAEQIRLFDRARLVVGPHGAGFTNMIFCRPGCHLLELVPRDYLTPLYWQIASAVSCSYEAIMINGAGFASTFSAPIQSILSKLKALL